MILRACVFLPSRIARTIGAENRIGRSLIVVISKIPSPLQHSACGND
jgi:hypothetical protein